MVAVLGAAFGLFGCGKESSPPAAAAAAPPPALPVTAITVAPRSVPFVIEAVGQAEGSREVEVRARVSGIVEKRAYNEGEPVRAGAVLFRIERAPYEIALAQARAALGEVRAKQEQAQREAGRMKELAAQRAISQKEYDDATSTLKQSASSAAAVEAQVRQAELNLSYTTVTAPISGVTGRAVRSEGSLVTAGTESSLLTSIMQFNPVWIRFSISEAEYQRMRSAEQRAAVSLVGSDGAVKATGGRLNFAASTVDPKLGTVQLRAEFANQQMSWLPGQFVRVRVLAGEQQAYLVPQAAVVQSEQSRLVWVVGPDGKAVMRPVQTANWIGNDWVVTGGLNAGDRVIVDNLIKLRPGAAVQPHPPGAAPAPAGPSAPPHPGASKPGPATPREPPRSDGGRSPAPRQT